MYSNMFILKKKKPSFNKKKNDINKMDRCFKPYKMQNTHMNQINLASFFFLHIPVPSTTPMAM